MSQKATLEAPPRVGLRKTSPKRKSTKVQYPVPKKPILSIIDGKTSCIIHKYVPTYHFMHVCPKAAAILGSRPWISQYKINKPYDAAAVSSVLHAITLSKPFPVTADLTKNLLTYEAALRLGITPSQPVLKPLMAAINALISRTPNTNVVLGFIEHRLGYNDPVFKHTANVLCYRRFKGEIQNVKGFERMVAKRPQLQSAMMQIDRTHKENREKRASLLEANEKKHVLGEKVAGGLEAALGPKRRVSNEHKEKLLGILMDKTEVMILEKTEKTG